ncbi:MAG: 3-deoxy-D-manno-octulosonic acid transferase [Gammaproteobacteria bacterium]|nr:MAG: 3-deoxy-D-manno-octulosonic acid transferase [Gammaproteobacteria bacterium]
MKQLYTLILTLALPLLILKLIWRGFRAPAYWRRWPERFGASPSLKSDKPLIWIHAVSVGEVEACRPLVSALKQEYPNHKILITTMTPTGSARVKLLFADSVAHCYLPYDLPFAIKRFLNQVKPAFGILMETEIWPNVISLCKQRNISLVLANARMSVRSATSYSRVPKFIKSILNNFDLIAAQTTEDKQRFLQLGATSRKVHIIGNLKYEVNLAVSIKEKASAMRDMWDSNRPVLVAASTHEGEEEMVLNAARQIRSQCPNLLLIIVPRHPERFDRVAALAQKSGCKTLRRSEQRPCASDVQILIVDTMGDLPLFYAACDVAFVGGSLVPHGGHNLLEPAALGRAIVTGPHFFNFNAITKQFLSANAALQVNNTEELADTVIRLLTTPQQRAQMGETSLRLIANSQGASTRLVNLIKYHVNHHEK